MSKLLLIALVLSGCTLKASIDPNVECTTSCDEQETTCLTTCKQECVDAGGGDTDKACDTDCDTTCSDAYDTCSLSCTSAS